MSSCHLPFVFTWSLAAALFCGFIQGTPKTEERCAYGPNPMRVGVRHIESQGIGYNQGYSTLEMFLGPNTENFSYYPFLDLRGHVFNNGRFATNAGIGMRYLGSSRVWGVQTYYDYRSTHRYHYNQVSLGLESLGPRWDFRLNGYLPVGKKESRWYHPKFGGFSGHHLYVRQRQEMAMAGLHAEAGVHINPLGDFNGYAAAGPYYFVRHTKNAWGGQLRLKGSYSDYVTLELRYSCDSVFHNNVQGELGFNFSFGPRSVMRPRRSTESCADLQRLKNLLVQPVQRDEIIAVAHRRKDFLAIDPATGKPYFFWFVNNTSHSQGTFESPFNNLLAAQNASAPGDIIYIYPGDGTTNGLDAFDTAFQLQDSQQLLGAGLPYTFQTKQGKITIPAQASGMPQLTANFETSVIMIGNNNTISGLSITAIGDPYGIGSDSGTATNLFVTNNFFTLENMAEGVVPNNIGGKVVISNNTFACQSTGATAIILNVNNVIGDFIIENNTIVGDQGDGDGIDVYVNNGSVNALIRNNNISACVNGISLESNLSSYLNAQILSNTLTNNSSAGVSVNNTDSTANTCLLFQNNQSSTDIYTFDNNGGTFNVEPLIGNQPAPMLTGTINSVPANTCP